MVLKAKIFISYAREDINCAVQLSNLLKGKSFNVFLDQESIFTGESFPQRIVENLKNSDAIILLITEDFISSDWCKLEANSAFILRKDIIPIRIGRNILSDLPFTLLEKNVNWFQVSSCGSIETIYDKINERLSITERRKKHKILKLFFVFSIILSSAILIITYSIKNLNVLSKKKERKEIIDKIRNSSNMLNSSDVANYMNKYNGDQVFLNEIATIASNYQSTPISILNANMLTGSLSGAHPLNKRLTIEKLDWKDSGFEDSNLQNVTFISGVFERLQFNDSNIYDVTFTQNLKFSDSDFKFSKLNGVRFNESNSVSLNFIGCVINGSYFNTTNFMDVNFITLPSTNNENVLEINASISTYITNTIFENNDKVDPKIEFDFVQEGMLKFKEVNFDHCTFIGLVRPEWFENCGFYNCTFPNDKIKNSISKHKKNFILDNR